MVNEAEIKVKSLQKALEILNCFTKKSSWGVTEISEQLDLNKSNVHNILSTFKVNGGLRIRRSHVDNLLFMWDCKIDSLACHICKLL
jgi:DNA-binding MarR family transcriptional regulator